MPTPDPNPIIDADVVRPTTRLVLRQPDDWHVHLRDGEMLAAVVNETAGQFARAIVMPNLDPPVTTVAAADAYRSRICAALAPGRRARDAPGRHEHREQRRNRQHEAPAVSERRISGMLVQLQAEEQRQQEQRANVRQGYAALQRYK